MSLKKLHGEAVAAIGTLDRKRRAKLCLIMIECMKGGYRAFCRDTSREPTALVYIDHLWDALSTSTSTGNERLRHFYTQIKSECPDTEEFTSVFTSPALDFCVSILYIIELLIGSDQKEERNVVENYIHYLETYEDVIRNIDQNHDTDEPYKKVGIALLAVLARVAKAQGREFEDSLTIVREAMCD